MSLSVAKLRDQFFKNLEFQIPVCTRIHIMLFDANARNFQLEVTPKKTNQTLKGMEKAVIGPVNAGKFQKAIFFLSKIADEAEIHINQNYFELMATSQDITLHGAVRFKANYFNTYYANNDASSYKIPLKYMIAIIKNTSFASLSKKTKKKDSSSTPSSNEWSTLELHTNLDQGLFVMKFRNINNMEKIYEIPFEKKVCQHLDLKSTWLGFLWHFSIDASTMSNLLSNFSAKPNKSPKESGSKEDGLAKDTAVSPQLSVNWVVSRNMLQLSRESAFGAEKDFSSAAMVNKNDFKHIDFVPQEIIEAIDNYRNDLHQMKAYGRNNQQNGELQNEDDQLDDIEDEEIALLEKSLKETKRQIATNINKSTKDLRANLNLKALKAFLSFCESSTGAPFSMQLNESVVMLTTKQLQPTGTTTFSANQSMNQSMNQDQQMQQQQQPNGENNYAPISYLDREGVPPLPYSKYLPYYLKYDPEADVEASLLMSVEQQETNCGGNEGVESESNSFVNANNNNRGTGSSSSFK